LDFSHYDNLVRVQHWYTGETLTIHLSHLEKGEELNSLIRRLQIKWGATLQSFRIYQSNQTNYLSLLDNRIPITTSQQLVKSVIANADCRNDLVFYYAFPINNNEKSPTQQPVSLSPSLDLLKPAIPHYVGGQQYDHEETSTISSSTIVSSGRFSYNSEISYRLKKTFDFKCLFCGFQGDEFETTASHILEKKEIDSVKPDETDPDYLEFAYDMTQLVRSEYMVKFGCSTGWNDPRNIICLCHWCHDAKAKRISSGEERNTSGYVEGEGTDDLYAQKKGKLQPGKEDKQRNKRKVTTTAQHDKQKPRKVAKK